jgi:predicted dehydrogenase
MSGLACFADGRTATFDCGFTQSLRGWLEISGTDGSIFVPEMWVPGPRATYIVRRIGSSPQEFAIEGADQIATMIDEFSWSVLEDRPVRPNPAEAVRTLRVLDALARSAAMGTPVDV